MEEMQGFEFHGRPIVRTRTSALSFVLFRPYAPTFRPLTFISMSFPFPSQNTENRFRESQERPHCKERGIIQKKKEGAVRSSRSRKGCRAGATQISTSDGEAKRALPRSYDRFFEARDSHSETFEAIAAT